MQAYLSALTSVDGLELSMGLEDANLVKNRNDRQASLLGDVKYGDRLRLDTLRGVYQ
jgi:hypothetical protein